MIRTVILHWCALLRGGNMQNEKVRVSLSITREAYDALQLHCAERGRGEFVSRLIMAYHPRNDGKLESEVVADSLPYDLPDGDTDAGQE